MAVGDNVEEAGDRQAGGSMMEQLPPEITTHVLSYLDYASLCRLSMTNSVMRKAANDDGAWKALYHRDFVKDTITPTNGWKAYYAFTKAFFDVNAGFYNIIRDGSLPAMSRLWLNADYVKYIHECREFTGYDAVMDRWALTFNGGLPDDGQGIAFQIYYVHAALIHDNMAWAYIDAYIDVDYRPFCHTNVYEFHDGQWFMVYHCSMMMLE